MNYINRKDGGTYISSNAGNSTSNPLGEIGIRPIAYNKDVAEAAKEMNTSYRKMYLASVYKDDIEALGIDLKDYLK